MRNVVVRRLATAGVAAVAAVTLSLAGSAALTSGHATGGTEWSIKKGGTEWAAGGTEWSATKGGSGTEWSANKNGSGTEWS